MKTKYGERLRNEIQKELVPLIGVYDVFSASIAARHFDGIFISGFSFAASHYGLPDIGFIAWPDIVAFTQRVRTILPDKHIVVDIDDGYVDVEVACHVVTLLENCGASGVILEDQKRPRKCGHYAGKVLLGIDEFTKKLQMVLNTRNDLFVVARTDATDKKEIIERVKNYSDVGADAILVDAAKDLDILMEISELTGCRVVFNQIAGGKSPTYSFDELKQAGVSLVNYSTPCLFASQHAIQNAMIELKKMDGKLTADQSGGVDLHTCTKLLQQNLYIKGN